MHVAKQVLACHGEFIYLVQLSSHYDPNLKFTRLMRLDSSQASRSKSRVRGAAAFESGEIARLQSRACRVVFLSDSPIDDNLALREQSDAPKDPSRLYTNYHKGYRIEVGSIDIYVLKASCAACELSPPN